MAGTEEDWVVSGSKNKTKKSRVNCLSRFFISFSLWCYCCLLPRSCFRERETRSQWLGVALAMTKRSSSRPRSFVSTPRVGNVQQILYRTFSSFLPPAYTQQQQQTLLRSLLAQRRYIRAGGCRVAHCLRQCRAAASVKKPTETQKLKCSWKCAGILQMAPFEFF